MWGWAGGMAASCQGRAGGTGAALLMALMAVAGLKFGRRAGIGREK